MNGVVSRRSALATLVAAAAVPAIASTERAVLAVSGLVSPAARDRFTMQELEALGTDGFETRTPWYTEKCRFDGVRLDRLMGAVGGAGQTLRVEALNDYAADIPVTDFAEFRPLLATRRNGALMPISDKGPLFVIYPFDDLPRTRHHAVYSRSVWQVARIQFR